MIKKPNNSFINYIYFKRAIDIILALILLLISWPLILILAICGRLFIGKQIFLSKKGLDTNPRILF